VIKDAKENGVETGYKALDNILIGAANSIILN
jgi:hypothetical protein